MSTERPAQVEVPAPVAAFLQCATPQTWVTAATQDLATLLIDHANCEKKAASTALSLMFRYAEEPALVYRMSRLAREELRHFEQVQSVMRRHGVSWRRLKPSRYAAKLRGSLRSAEPGRLVDELLVAAHIEARSCERFALLAPWLDPDTGGFYTGLLRAEARHFEQYLSLARRYATDAAELAERCRTIGAAEAALACEPDAELRFHSGPPPA
jgi:tRNA-(ms[2]io[6]A)-hydroxylase